MTLAIDIEAFVTTWRDHRPPPLGERIATFAQRWRMLAPPPFARRSAGPALTPDRLAAAVARLRPALTVARASDATFDPWRLAELRRDEVRNARALAGLLAPRGGHNLGPLALAALFDALQASAPDCPRPDDLAQATVAVERRPLGSARDRVDLVVDHPQLLLFVEIKIDAGEGVRQLERYAEAAAATARFTGRPAWRLAYLTRRRTAAPNVIGIDWRTLAQALRVRLAVPLETLRTGAAVNQLLDHFASI